MNFGKIGKFSDDFLGFFGRRSKKSEKSKKKKRKRERDGHEARARSFVSQKYGLQSADLSA